VLATLLAARPCVFALDPTLDVSQYAHTAWKIREGFTKGEIISIAQTPDGYIWLGTEFGLLRFDGVRFLPWQPPVGEQLPCSFIRSLVVTRDGTLWIGTLKGLASWRNGKLVQYPTLADQTVNALIEDDQGTTWAGTTGIAAGRICAIQNSNVQCYGEDGSLGQYVHGLFEDNRKNVWAATATGIRRWKPGPPKLYPMPNPVGSPQCLVQDNREALLISTSNGIKQIVNGKTEAYPLPGVGQRVKSRNLFRDRDGGLWVATVGRGLLHVHQGKTDVFTPSDGLSGDYITVLFEDREGDIWVATNGGLDRFREFAVATFSVRQGLSQATVGSVLATKDGSVWLTDGDLQRWNNRKILTYGKRGGRVSERTPHSLFQDSRGRIWVCTLDGVGYLENDRFVSVPGIPGGPVRGIAEDSVENLWIANLSAGLIRLSARSEVQLIPWAKLGRKDFATTLAVDPLEGGLWLGFYNGGIAYFRDGQIRASYSVPDGLGEGFVGRVRFDPDGTVWAATQGGLSRLKNGRVATLTSKNGLPCDEVHWVILDTEHSLWLGMPCGLTRIARPELDAWAAAVDKDAADKDKDVKQTQKIILTTVFDSSDGVRIGAFPGGYTPRVTRSSDGKLWFATNDGVSLIDPRHIHSNQLPPPVQIEQITEDHKTYDVTVANGSLRLPPLLRDLRIDYTALSLVAPEKVRSRYKLEGWDRDWQDAGTRRQAFYSNLPPRNYTFRVKACNNSGVWNEAGTSPDFFVAPAYYQTWWFRSLCVAAFLASLFALHRLRLHHVEQQFNMRLEGRVAERTRIARDLHDTLLQSFQGVLHKFHAVTYMVLDRPAEAQKTLQNVIEQARQAITEGRDAVQGLRSSTLPGNDLARAISMLGEELTTHQPENGCPAFRVQVEGTTRDLAPIVRDDVYRIVGEALRNAFRHAHAEVIEVEIRYDQRQLRVRIRDDGKGIDPRVLEAGARSGHYGLPGMHERAKLIGGKFTVWSEVNSGAEAELTIPGAIAYVKSGAVPRGTHSQMGT
jgi:signal transduction histidine kinase/ligand-binding sensor domain-containing protein